MVPYIHKAKTQKTLGANIFRDLIRDLTPTKKPFQVFENGWKKMKNIYKTGELEPDATAKDFLVVRTEGKRRVKRIDVYDYREIHVNVYRTLYQIIKSDVFIYGILVGRRNIPDILQRPIFRPERIMHDSMEIVEPFQNT